MSDKKCPFQFSKAYYHKERQQILIFEKLNPAFVEYLFLVKRLKIIT